MDLWIWMKKNGMALLMLLGMFLGFILGVIIRIFHRDAFNGRQAMYVSFLGELYIRALNTIALPFTMFCIIYSLGALDIKVNRRFSLQFLLYFIVTKLWSMILAVSLALIVWHEKPGGKEGSTTNDYFNHLRAINFPKSLTGAEVFATDGYFDIVRNMFPGNVIEMTVKQYGSHLIVPPIKPNATQKPRHDWTIHGGLVDTVEMLGIVNLSIVIGFSICLMRLYGSKFSINILYAFCELTAAITSWVRFYAPVAVFSLVAGLIVSTEKIDDLMGNAGIYVCILVSCFLIQILVIYPLIYLILVRKNPLYYIGNIAEALFTACTTTSTITTLPITVRCMEEHNKINKKLVRLIIPLGSTVNKDGDVMFLCISAIFIAHTYNFNIGIGEIFVIGFLSIPASLANSGVRRGIVMSLWLFFLNDDDGIKMNPEQLAILFVVDKITSGVQMCVNVLGSCIGLGVLVSYNNELVETIPEDNEGS